MSDTPDKPVKLRLGTRRSPLAMAQAEEARDRLCAAHGWEQSAVELVPVMASGDRIQDRPLAEIGGKALWTRELDLWLHEDRIDAAVHSMKDVETLRPDWLAIAAILPRADKRDVLVGAVSIETIPQGAKVGTSAPRRAAQMLSARPDVDIVMFRGNVATRLAKLEAGEADVTLLAKAGLDRLGDDDVGTPLELNDWMPAPGQGAIGIECRADDAQALGWLAAIDDAPSRAEVEAERALLAALGGTCHSPVGMDTRWHDDRLAINCCLLSPDGSESIQFLQRVEGPHWARSMASALLEHCDPKTRAVFDGPH